jgi:hypothetical protein
MVRARWLVITIVTCLGIVSCNTAEKPFSCVPTPIEQTDTRSTPLGISIQVDGSSSMLGYVSDAGSLYVQTLKLLDETLSLVSKTPVQYYRSGNALTRSDFRKAQLPTFYNGTDFPDVSAPIQNLIVEPGTKNSLQVIVTDLDQASGDVTLLTRKIQETYLNSKHPEYAVAIWAIQSEFEGTVYVQEQNRIKKFPFPNEKSSNKFRPFYVVFIGRHNDITQYFASLQERQENILANSKIAIFSPNHLVKEPFLLDREIEEKPAEEKAVLGEWNLSLNGFRVQAKDQNNQLWKIPQTSTDAIEISDSVSLDTIEHTVAIDIRSIEPLQSIEVPNKFSNTFQNSKEVLKDDSNLQKAIKISKWNLDSPAGQAPRKLNFVTTIHPDKFPEPGIYLFTIDLVAKNLQEQPWWEEWNWQIGRDNQQDGSKTNNLLPFLRGLKTITANLMAENPPKIGRFCYAIEKN